MKYRTTSSNDPFGTGVGATLDDRSRDIFRLIVDSYLDNGEPVGSRNI